MNNKIIYLLLLILVSSFVSADYIDDLDNNLNAWWKMEDANTQLTDYKTTYDLATGANINYQESGAIDFGTHWMNNYDISTGLNVENDGSNFSFGCWVKPDANDGVFFGTTGGYSMLMVGNTGGAWCTNDKYCFRIYDTGSKIVESSTSKTGTAYDLVVGTYDGVNMKIFVNSGNFEASTATTGASSANTYYMGGRNGLYYYDGKLDECFYYQDFVLNQTHVEYIYNSGSGRNPPFAPVINTIYVYANLFYPGANTSMNENFYGFHINHSVDSSCTINDTSYFKYDIPSNETNNGGYLTSDCIHGSCYIFNESNTNITIDSDTTFNLSERYTLTFWIKPEQIYSDGNTQKIIVNQGEDKIYIGSGDKFLVNFAGFGVPNDDSAKKNVWQHLAIVTAGIPDTVTFYVNGSSVGGMTNSQAFGNKLSNIVIGNNNVDWNFTIDEVRFYNSTFTITQILADMQSITPVDPEHLVYYGSFGDYIHTIFYNNVSDGNHSVIVNCTNVDNEFKVLPTWLRIDTQEPPINYTFPKEDNSSIVTDNNNIFNLNISISDNYLYLANLTIFNSSGSLMYNNFINFSGTGNTSHVWNQSLNIQSWQKGQYLIFAEGTDSHTTKKIKSFKPKININDKKVAYDTPTEWGGLTTSIKLKSSQNIIDIYDIKSKDRHSPVFKFDKPDKDKKNTYTFSYTCDHVLNYMGEDKIYKGWLTCLNGMKGTWFDANHDNDFNSDIKVKKISANEFEIDITTSLDEIKFNSLGGLNYNSKNVTFEYQKNLTIFLQDTATSVFIQNYSIWVNGTYYYVNGTNRTITVNASKTYYINGSKNNYVINPTDYYSSYDNQTLILNGTSSGATLYFYDESTLNLINDRSVSIDIIPINTNTSLQTNTNTGVKIITNLANGSYEIRYNAPDYYPRSYFVDLDIDTLPTVNLYLLKQNVSDRVIYTLYDQDGNDADNITIKLLRYYAGSNTYITVSMAKTNYEGQVPLYVELYDIYYKMIYEGQDGTIHKITDVSPFLSTTSNDLVNLELNSLYSWALYDNAVYNLSFINQSGQIYARFIYSSNDNVVRTGCLKVQRYTTRDIYNVCNNCTNSSSAILTCSINTSLDGSYKAVALIDTPTAGSWYTVLAEYYNIITDKDTGQQGIFIATMTIITFTFMGIGTIAGSIILMIVGIVGVSLLGLIQGFTIGYIWYLLVLGLIVIFVIRRSIE